MSRAPVSVVVPTFNEEVNLPHCLASLEGWADEVFVLDSFSTDRTQEIAKERGARLHNLEFKGYPHMRNWALDHLPFRNEWILFLDADEQASDGLRSAIAEAIGSAPAEVDGFYVKRRFIFLGRWIRHGGYYPIWLLRLVRRGRARCEERSVNEHFVVEGETRRIDADILHEDRRDLSAWIRKHDRYATLEAQELFRTPTSEGRLAGTQAERKRWIRERVWTRLPPLVRPFLYFNYRYCARLGFLDGREGLAYHFLQGLWFPLLIDVKYLEMKRSKAAGAREGDGAGDGGR